MKRFVGFSNEKVLLEALKVADDLAVEYWFKHYRRPLLKIARHKLPDENSAQEIVQETFISCLRSLTLFKGESSLSTWMQSVMRHEIADFYRKRYAKKFIRSIPLSDFLLDHQYKDAHQTAEAVKIVLKQMAKKSQELLMKKYVDQLQVKEIAAQFGKSEKAIESDLFRARREFRLLWLAQEEAN